MDGWQGSQTFQQSLWNTGDGVVNTKWSKNKALFKRMVQEILQKKTKAVPERLKIEMLNHVRNL